MTATVKSPTVDVGTILELPTDELNDLMQEIKHQTRVKEGAWGIRYGITG